MTPNESETPLFGELREAKTERTTWEGTIYDIIEQKLDVTRSDAQGIVDGQDWILNQSWGKNLSAEKTAKLIIDAAVVPEGETPLFTEFKDNKSTPSFADFVDERRAIKSLPYLNESENAQVNEFVDLFESECDNDINLLDEGFLGKIVGGVAGFLVGPTIGRIVANALGIDRGILYDMFTSRLVSTALGAAIAKSVGKTPAR